jgi:Arc/MetJ-type ribon-helix-helix transcriptional regulator
LYYNFVEEKVLMETAVTVRLDAKTRRKLSQVAERRRISKSEVIRRALNASPDFQETPRSAYEAMADFIGVLNGGDPKRSENAGEKFKKYVKRKWGRS